LADEQGKLTYDIISGLFTIMEKFGMKFLVSILSLVVALFSKEIVEDFTLRDLSSGD
jgi:hypothetical protein